MHVGSPPATPTSQDEQDAELNLNAAKRIIRACLGVSAPGGLDWSWRLGADMVRLLELRDDAGGLSVERWAQLLAEVWPSEYDPPLSEPTTPTTDAPGSTSRIAVYADRVETEQAIYHPGDVRNALVGVLPGNEPDLPPVPPQTQPLGIDTNRGRLPSRERLGPRRQRRWSLRRGVNPLYNLVEYYDTVGRLVVCSIEPATPTQPAVEPQREPERGELVAV